MPKTAGDAFPEVIGGNVAQEAADTLQKALEEAEERSQGLKSGRINPNDDSGAVELVLTLVRIGAAIGDDWEAMIKTTGSHFPRIDEIRQENGYGRHPNIRVFVKTLVNMRHGRPAGIPWPYNPEALEVARYLSRVSASGISAADAYREVSGLTVEEVSQIKEWLQEPGGAVKIAAQVTKIRG